MSSPQGNASMSPTSTPSNTPISAKNGTAGTTVKPSQQASTGGYRLMQLWKASHAQEMEQDSFTLVNRSMTYAMVVASSAPRKTQRPIETNGPATIKGALTTKIGNQTISTIITIPSEGQAKQQGLLDAQMKLRQALYTMFGMMKDPTVPPTPTPAIAIWVATTKKPLSKGTGHNVVPRNSELK
jgi:hypothetical protein